MGMFTFTRVLFAAAAGFSLQHVYLIIGRASYAPIACLGMPSIDPDLVQGLFNDSRSTQPRALLTQLILMSALSFIMMFLFEVLRPMNKYVYEPKTIYHPPNKQPPPISSSFWGWISPVFRTNEEDLFNRIGLDAVAFLRFLRLMRFLLTVTAVITCGALIPLDRLYTVASNPPLYDLLSSFTIRDVRGDRLYAHIASEYIITFLLFGLLYYHWVEMYRLRQQWFRSPQYQTTFYARTLMITNIPPKYRSEEGLWKIFQVMELKHQVTSVHIGKAVGMLPELVERHNKNVEEFEQLIVKHLKKDPHGDTKPTIRVGGCCGLGGRRQDAIKLHVARLNRSVAAVEQYRAQMHKDKPESYGFASMASIPACHGAAYDLRNEHPKGMNIRLAPNPSDIFWKNIAMSRPKRRFRIISGFALLGLLCGISVVALFPIASLANLTTLARSGAIPFLRTWISASPKTYALVSGVVPPALAAIFSYFLPRLMRSLSKYMGANTYTELGRVVIARYFAFTIISQLIVFTVIGVIYKSVLELVQALHLQKVTLQIIFANLDKIPGRLSRTYVDQSTFWLTWFLLRGFLVMFNLSQLDRLIWVSFKSCLFGRTPREIREWAKPPLFDYDINYAEFLFMGTVGLVFSPLAPLVPLVAAIVFWISSFVYKYQLTYVFATRVDGGGGLWNVVLNRIILSAIFMQVITIFTIGLQIEFKSLQLVAAAPPLAFTLLFKQYLKQRFVNDFQYYLPRHEEITRSMVYTDRADMAERKLENRYDHPALNEDLFTPLIHAKHMPTLHRLLKGKHKETNLARGVEKASVFAKSIRVDDTLGVNLTPLNEDEVLCEPTEYSEECEEVCDVDLPPESIFSSEESAPWRHLNFRPFQFHDQNPISQDSLGTSGVLPGHRQYQSTSQLTPTLYHTAAESQKMHRGGGPGASANRKRLPPDVRMTPQGSTRRTTLRRHVGLSTASKLHPGLHGL